MSRLRALPLPTILALSLFAACFSAPEQAVDGGMDAATSPSDSGTSDGGSPAHHVCSGTGGPCGASGANAAPCCEGLTCGGTSCGFLPDGGTCSGSREICDPARADGCCSGLSCRVATGFKFPICSACTPGGGACAADAECCSAVCAGGQCTAAEEPAPSCAQGGFNDPCLPGYRACCNDEQVCRDDGPGAPRCCLPPGAVCGTSGGEAANASCCSGNCTTSTGLCQ